jgi:hypothetical protein
VKSIFPVDFAYFAVADHGQGENYPRRIRFPPTRRKGATHCLQREFQVGSVARTVDSGFIAYLKGNLSQCVALETPSGIAPVFSR